MSKLAARAAGFWCPAAARLAGLAALPRHQVGMLPLVARVAALPPPRRERVQDLGLGTALAAVNVVSLLPYLGQLHPAWVAVTLVAAQGVPLTWRRSWPVSVMIAIGGVRIAYDQIGFGYAPLPLGPAIAFYTVVDRSCPVLRRITIGGAAAGISISGGAPGHHEPYDAIFQAMIFITAWAAGVLSRATRASMQAARSRGLVRQRGNGQDPRGQPAGQARAP